MSNATRITEKGQATIPKELREKYDLSPGDEVIWKDTDDGIVVKKRTRTGGRGMLVPEEATDAEREDVAAELEERLRGRRDRNYEDV
ncbi:AbrB/MazE/SpoVT family DNA-binding domain-containing protein [Halobellus ruber]|uniref:AbrB/MazE/SpoVT family DNA-binding domain-containing protein n=1 Tax=Halobellus ruber TaxID=2761102 RepID=A0A7J9SCU2_9EURY|nr:AbrB/MazE/SpoVT family DNA-binding domain-containing protein [Halobellus ruber]MBB6644734.1 AbrB/MazE/SpoVT family DNA-binding domain-containing protein [Halobellus ruber]